MMSHTYEYRVGMTCNGCANAIGRVLSKTQGVDNYTTDVDSKQVVITGTVTKETIDEKLNKWASASGKEVTFIKQT